MYSSELRHTLSTFLPIFPEGHYGAIYSLRSGEIDASSIFVLWSIFNEVNGELMQGWKLSPGEQTSLFNPLLILLRDLSCLQRGISQPPAPPQQQQPPPSSQLL